MTLDDQHPAKLELPSDLYGRADCLPTDRKHNGATYVWLAYSAFFFIEPIARHSGRYWLQQMPYFAVFLALYVSYVQFERQAVRLALIAAIFVLGIVTMPTNVGGSAFFIYVAALLPFCIGSARWMVGAIAVVLLVLAGEYQLVHENGFNYLLTAFFVHGRRGFKHLRRAAEAGDAGAGARTGRKCGAGGSGRTRAHRARPARRAGATRFRSSC